VNEREYLVPSILDSVITDEEKNLLNDIEFTTSGTDRRELPCLSCLVIGNSQS